jgi:15-cis-phytoene synthase
MPQAWSNSNLTAARDLAACRASLRGGSRTFYAASRVLPRPIAQAASALYAFCRLADDAVDCGLGSGREHAIAQLRERLARAYQGAPLPFAADRALAHVLARYRIPRALPEALLEGFEWDAAGRRYATLEQLHDYAARVAGGVGVMMSLLMDVRSSDALARASDLGVAMQLTNIARDVGEDARAGRLYLPTSWLAEVGIDAQAFLAQPTYTPALGAVIDRLLRAADALYERARVGVALLPAGCRPGIEAARSVYAEIGRELERKQRDSVTQRAIVPGWRKCLLLLRALPAALPSLAARRPHRAPLAANRFLIDAVLEQARFEPASMRGFKQRLLWLLDLYERLERRERAVV